MNQCCKNCARWTPLPTRFADGKAGWGMCGTPDTLDYDEVPVKEIVIVGTKDTHVCPIWKELDSRG